MFVPSLSVKAIGKAYVVGITRYGKNPHTIYHLMEDDNDEYSEYDVLMAGFIKAVKSIKENEVVIRVNDRNIRNLLLCREYSRIPLEKELIQAVCDCPFSFYVGDELDYFNEFMKNVLEKKLKKLNSKSTNVDFVDEESEEMHRNNASCEDSFDNFDSEVFSSDFFKPDDEDDFPATNPAVASIDEYGEEEEDDSDFYGDLNFARRAPGKAVSIDD